MQSTHIQNDPLLKGMPNPDRGLLKKVLVLMLGDASQAVTLQSSVVLDIIKQCAQIGAGLPVAQMSAVQKGAVRRVVSAMPPSLQRKTAAVLRQVGPLLGSGVPSADQVEGHVQRQRRYEAVRGQAARGMTLAANLRTVLLTYAWFIINDTLTHVTGVIDDPKTPALEREQYRARFSALLRYKETVLRAVAAGRDQAKAQKTDHTGAVQKLQNEGLVADVAMAVKNGWPLDPDSLAKAATYYYQQMRTAAPAGTPAAAAAPPTTATASNSRRSPR